MSRGSALLSLVRDAARLDRTQSDPIVSARNAVGVAAPLAIGALAGGAALGLPSAIGALQTAFADRPGPYRLRMIRMATTALAAAITSTLAVALSGNAAASAALLLVVGLVAGLLLAAGPSGTQVGVAATAAAVILGHQAQRPGVALHVGLLVLAGGLGQLVLAIAAWPLGRHRPERLALAGLYRQLAAIARRPPGSDSGPPLGEVLAGVRQTLSGLGHDHGPSVEAHRVLLDEAERIRREVIVLNGYGEQLRSESADQSADALRAVLERCARLLDAIARSLAEGRPLDASDSEPVRAEVAQALEILDSPSPEMPGRVARHAAAARLRSLSGQLRAAVETATTGATEASRGDEPAVYGVSRLRDPIAMMRANMSLDSAVLRHAVRLGVLVSASDLAVRIAHVDRGYWIPLTVVVVLRPDFASTFQRSVLRVLGTIAGLLLATALVHWIPGGEWYSITLIALFVFGMRLAGPGNFGLGALSLAALVVILLSLAGVAPHSTVVVRGVDTAAGGLLALVAILLWPVWERRLVTTRLAELLGAYREYTLTIADLTWNPDRLQRARAAARLARTNAQASVDRARAEPVTAAREVEIGAAVLAHSHRFIHAMLTIEGLRPALRDAGGVDELAAFLRLGADVLMRCDDALRTGIPPAVEPRLRTVQQELVAGVSEASPFRSRSEVSVAELAAALIESSDRIANSLDTLVDALRRQLSGTFVGAE